MIKTITCLLLVCCISAAAFSQDISPEHSGYPPVTIPRTEVRSLHSEINGTKYHLYVAFPYSYSSNLEKDYPVIYFTDANDGMGLYTQIQRNLRYQRNVPEMIIVGIAFETDHLFEFLSMRNSDLTPTRMPDLEKIRSEQFGYEVQTGNADLFIQVIRDEIKPLINSNYRTSGDDAYAGISLGGLFGMYVLFNATALFDRYLIGSPSLWWGKTEDPNDPDMWLDGPMFSAEEKYAATHEDLHAKVFVSVGSLESSKILPGTRKMVSLLTSRKYPNLDLVFKEFEGETHVSVIPGSISRGLRVLYEGFEE